jgi:S-adenosylmethionine-diacylglycerol 3-amino-3-carboxypropyl transferase
MHSATADLLQEAVHDNPSTSVKGLLERLFTIWFDGFIYNQTWEDPRVDVEALGIDASSRIFTISSAGCNVLNYLIGWPESVTAVDLNHHHLSLTRLKLAALEHLPDYESFFQFFAGTGSRHNVENYYRHIHHRLDPSTRRYWERRVWLGKRFIRSRINYFADNFYRYSSLGSFIRFLHFILKPKQCRRILEANTREQQAECFASEIDPFFSSRRARWLARLPFILYALGIPPRQFDSMLAECGGDVLDLCRQRVRRLACDFPIQDNYFAWQAFGGRYDVERRRAVPDYLKHENYAAMRVGLRRARTALASVTRHLKEQPSGAFNRFVFLDAQDWMSAAQMEELWQEVTRVGGPGCRIIFRTAVASSPIESALSPRLRLKFQYERELSQRLHQQDRSAIYGGFHVYSMV